MALFGFLGDLHVPQPCDLLGGQKPDVPKKTPGAYVLVAESGTLFRYPGGESSVFYIGQASRLRRRLLTHRKNILLAKAEDRLLSVYRPVAEYGAAFGAHYVFIPAQPGGIPEDMEIDLMARFAQQYRSLPIANSAGSWKRIRNLITKANKLAE
jgi:hypothetical protein